MTSVKARRTSFAFMLLWVPLPVWKTTSGKWSISLPEMTCVTSFSITVWAIRYHYTDLIGGLLNRLADLGVQTVSDIDD